MDTYTTTQTPASAALGRSSFILKTYAHVAGAILAFLAIEYALFASGIAFAIAEPLASNWLLVIGGLVLVSYLASRFTGRQYGKGVQYGVMAGFICVEAAIFVPLLIALAYVGGASALSEAALITLGMVIVLSAVVYLFRANFTFMGPFLAIAGIAALALIVLSLLFGFELGTLFIFAMITYAAGALVYETSNVLHNYGEDEYVGASLAILTSILLLLWYVAQAVMGDE